MQFKPLNKKDLPEGIDSLQEVYFEWWLQELIDLGYLKRYNRSKNYKLIDSVYKTKLDFKPTKKQPNRHLLVQRSILQSWSYEPDYDLYWEEKSFNFLFQDIDFLYRKDFETLFYAEWVNGEWMSIVDIKPISFRGGNMSSSVKFPIIQKMMYKKYEVYIHKISPVGKGSLFQKTFTPERYLFQDRKQVKRKISLWKPISIKQFISDR